MLADGSFTSRRACRREEDPEADLLARWLAWPACLHALTAGLGWVWGRGPSGDSGWVPGLHYFV